jgi:DNA-binding response OmpR family regulator
MTALASQLAPLIRTRILVVDPRQSDYDGLLRLAAADGCEVRLFATSRALLRQRHEALGGLVFINGELPDLSGFDLVEMLQPFSKGTVVFLVADQYAVEDEVRALRLGVNCYLCKPLDGDVLHQCRSIWRALAKERTEDHQEGRERLNPSTTQAPIGQANRSVSRSVL